MTTIDKSNENEKEYYHLSDCATHNAPALEPGDCDCRKIPFKWDISQERVPEAFGEEIIKLGEFIGEGGHVKDCFWSGYKYKGLFYIGLNNYADSIWPITEKNLLFELQPIA